MARKQNRNEFNEMCSLLENTDVNDDIHKEPIYSRLKSKIETGTIHQNNKKEDGIYMKRKKSIAITALTFVCLVGGFSATTYGKGMYQSIVGTYQTGNTTITQLEREQLPKNQNELNLNNQNKPIEKEKPAVNTDRKKITLKETRTALKTDLALPTWLPDGFKYSASWKEAENAVQLVYLKDDSTLTLLISKGGANGIDSFDVKKETIAGKTVYLTNSEVVWEQDGLTYELFQNDIKLNTTKKIISSMSTEVDLNDGLYQNN